MMYKDHPILCTGGADQITDFSVFLHLYAFDQGALPIVVFVMQSIQYQAYPGFDKFFVMSYQLGSVFFFK